MTIDPPQAQLLTKEQVIDKTHQESLNALKDPYVFPKPIKNVAVIGAGPAGLVAAKAMKEQGMHVTVFDRAKAIGGTWLYQKTAEHKIPVPNTEQVITQNGNCSMNAEKKLSDGDVVTETEEEAQRLVDAHAPPSGCYYALYNNTPTPMIEYEDFPYPSGTPWYISHAQLQTHLHNYATNFKLHDHIELNTNIEHVDRVVIPETGASEWIVTARKCERVDKCKLRYSTWKATFDAVVVATGIFQKAYMPPIDKLAEYDQKWPDKVLHAKQFRHCSAYAGKNVLLVGSHVSAVDLAQRMEDVANKVYMVVRGDWKNPGSDILKLIRSGIPQSTIHKPEIKCFADKHGNVNGTITFMDDTTLEDIDSVVFCTGYKADFHYLGALCAHEKDPQEAKEKAIVVTDDIKPLTAYRDLFAMDDPTLAFVGIARHLHGLGHFWYQGQAVARVWSQAAQLPSQEAMRAFMDKYELPFVPHDMSTVSEQLHIQRIVTWLNTHAEHLNSPVNRLKGMDDSVMKIWDKVTATWHHRTKEIVAAAKQTPVENGI
ncbi:FAD/NAD(P)-binding domain-containing protein [Lichtheimia hyalospora FSU 10163]|nr:FAD/NAD(P)-binding domain-containing protein [Lichtheimia hyalospora FSU 10163]